jgi:hypothetical protein
VIATTARNNPRAGRYAGYILLEAVVSMALLSVSVIGINASLRQALLVKGDAQDYTQARFILEQQIAKVELQRQLNAVENSGTCPGDLSRFSWRYKVTKIELPQPELPADIPPERLQSLKLAAPYMAKIEATVTWSRAGIDHQETIETLWIPEKLWTPPEDPLAAPNVS